MPRLNLQVVSQRLAEESDIMCSSCEDVAAIERDGYCDNCADYWEDADADYNWYEFDPEPEDDYLDDLAYDELVRINLEDEALEEAYDPWDYMDYDYMGER